MSTRKPKLCIVTWFNCLRAIKESIGAWNLGYELELITKQRGLDLVNELQYGHMYDCIRVYDNNSQMEAAIQRSKADIFWCHNEPDTMAVLCNENKGKRIVIHDCHDLPTLHPGHEQEFLENEIKACQHSDYIFVPTPAYIDLINKKHGTPKERIIVVNSCPPETFFPDGSLPYTHGMLYCGQVNVPEMQSQLRYRDCQPMFKYLTSLGVTSHIYNTSPDANMMPYIIAGAQVHSTMRMYAAIHQYTRYDYGFVGSPINCPEIQMCMPNKLFDCIAAGLPIINLNARVAGEFVLTNDIGVDVYGTENLEKVPWIKNVNGTLTNYDFWQQKRANVLKIRYEYTAEKEVRKAFDKIGI